MQMHVEVLIIGGEGKHVMPATPTGRRPTGLVGAEIFFLMVEACIVAGRREIQPAPTFTGGENP